MNEGKFTREFPISARAENDDRTIDVAFSSEVGVQRFFGTEILDHGPESIRLDRLNDGGAVLVDHDTRDHVGVVESARVDDDRTARATLRFGSGSRASEVYQDVVDGIRRLISVGYRVHKFETDEDEGIYRAMDWEPFEISIVSIPADPTVGVGRSVDETQSNETETLTMSNETETREETRSETNAPEIDLKKERQLSRRQERERVSTIQQLGDEYDCADLARKHIDDESSVSDMRAAVLDVIGERNNKARTETQHDGEATMTQRDRENFSITRLMAAIADPNDRQAQSDAGFELEVSADAVREFGNDFKVRGAYVPQSILVGQRDLSAGTATDGAELVATNLLAASYIDVLRNSSAALQAGVTMLPGLVGNVAIPRSTAGAAFAWISAEGGNAAQSDMQFDQVTLSPKDLACYTEVTRRLVQQSTPAIEGLVRRDMAQAAGLGIDNGVLYGSGASGQPQGISGATGVNNFNFAAADPVYAEIIRMKKEVMADNAISGTPVFIVEANGWEALSTTPKQGSGVEGNFILNDNTDRIIGHQYFISNQLTAEDYFFGDFSQVLLGEWGGLEVNVDPYSNSLSGTVRFVFFKTVDVGIRHAEHFCFCNDGV